jgi:hypothetical protein
VQFLEVLTFQQNLISFRSPFFCCNRQLGTDFILGEKGKSNNVVKIGDQGENCEKIFGLKMKIMKVVKCQLTQKICLTKKAEINRSENLQPLLIFYFSVYILSLSST